MTSRSVRVEPIHFDKCGNKSIMPSSTFNWQIDLWNCFIFILDELRRSRNISWYQRFVFSKG